MVVCWYLVFGTTDNNQKGLAEGETCTGHSWLNSGRTWMKILAHSRDVQRGAASPNRSGLSRRSSL